jgi:hypothetical protein
VHVVRNSWRACRPLLSLGGEVHVTLKLSPPYNGWGIEEVASQAYFVHYDTLAFQADDFPGYQHRTTKAGAYALDTDTREAKKHIRTLVFRRVKAPESGKPPFARVVGKKTLGSSGVFDLRGIWKITSKLFVSSAPPAHVWTCTSAMHLCFKEISWSHLRSLQIWQN